MKLEAVIITAVLVTFAFDAMADSPRAPVPWVTASRNGSFLFKMVPPETRGNGDKTEIVREAFGTAYSITTDGEFRELWKTDGWYTFDGYISNDGRYFARIGPWASDLQNHTDLAIAFYDRGQLLKRYEVRALVKNLDKLEYSASHYDWHPQIQSVPNGFQNDRFHLVTIDKIAYAFDYTTGEIANSATDTGAKTWREIRAAEQATAEAKGTELFHASPLSESYSRHFHISKMEAMEGSYYGCSLEGPGWTATLKPKKPLRHDAEATVVFPIIDGHRLEASLTPTDVLNAFRCAFDHPFISKRFTKGGATRIRLRTQGDRLHWDTPELSELLSKSTGQQPDHDSLRAWAYLIIDAKKPRYTSVYVDTRTKRLLYEDDSKWPYEPVLLDADGQVLSRK